VSWLLAAAANLVVFPYAVAARDFGYLPTHAFAVSLTLSFFARDVLIALGTWAWLRSELDRDDQRSASPGQQFPARKLQRLATGGAPV
jgi:hypothetical protein